MGDESKKNRIPGMKAAYDLYDKMTDTTNKFPGAMSEGAQTFVRGVNAAGEKGAEWLDGGKYDFSKRRGQDNDTLAQAVEFIKQGMRGHDYDNNKPDHVQNPYVNNEDYMSARNREKARAKDASRKPWIGNGYMSPNELKRDAGRGKPRDDRQNGEDSKYGPGAPSGWEHVGTDAHGLKIFKSPSGEYKAYDNYGHVIHTTTDIDEFDIE